MTDALSAASAAGASTPPEGVVNYSSIHGKAAQFLLRRLNRLPLAIVAGAVGKDESTACRIRSGERGCNAEEFCALLDVSGLKLVDKRKRCVDPEVHDFLVREHEKSVGSGMFRQRVAELDEDEPE